MKDKKNNKFYTIIDSLTESEKKEFSEFLRLSFIKRQRFSDIIIEKIQSGFDLHLYLESKYSERTIWNIYSELTGAIGKFLALKEIVYDEKEMHKLKRKFLSKRNIGKILINEYKNEIKFLRTSEVSFSTFENIHQNAKSYVLELIKNGLSEDFYNINKLKSDHLVIEFLFETITSYIEDRIRTEFYGENPELLNVKILKFIDIRQIQDLINENYPEYKYPFDVIIDIYFSLTETDDFKYFIKAKDKFLLYKDKYSPNFKSEIFLTLINICNYFAVKKRKNMNGHMLELFKSKIDSGLVEDLKILKIGENHFRDYIYVALKENDVKWAEQFLDKYSPLLPESVRDNNIYTSKAFIYYHKKNYSMAVSQIKKIKRRFYINDFDFYSIQIFSSFDSGNIIECIRLKNRFQEYVNKNSNLPNAYKTGIKNFIKVLSALINYKESTDNSILTEIEFLISNSNELTWRIWLTDKLNELKNKN